MLNAILWNKVIIYTTYEKKWKSLKSVYWHWIVLLLLYVMFKTWVIPHMLSDMPGKNRLPFFRVTKRETTALKKKVGGGKRKFLFCT